MFIQLIIFFLSSQLPLTFEAGGQAERAKMGGGGCGRCQCLSGGRPHPPRALNLPTCGQSHSVKAEWDEHVPAIRALAGGRTREPTPSWDQLCSFRERWLVWRRGLECPGIMDCSVWKKRECGTDMSHWGGGGPGEHVLNARAHASSHRKAGVCGVG